MKLYIGENLQRLRREKNVTQDDLAEYLGITYQAVSRWENGLAYPDIEFLPELANYFEVTLEELLGTKSDESKIRHSISECYFLNESGHKDEALAKLRALEREHPNNWIIKQAICSVLVYPKPESYDTVLPELRGYAEEGLKRCSMKDAWAFRYIISTLLMAVPEEELKVWLPYIPAAHNPNRNTVLAERYTERNDPAKAKHYGSEAILSNLLYLTMQYPDHTGTAAETIQSRECKNAAINAVIGKPYRKDGRIHNSIMLWERAVNQTQIAAGYAGMGETQRGLAELEEAVDLWIFQADALREAYFTSDSPYLEDWKNRWIDKFQGVNYGIDALTDAAEWAWFDSIRNDERFAVQLARLTAKKEELSELFGGEKAESET